jgi:eukaryotic-like serine/threonine-protein kinase
MKDAINALGKFEILHENNEGANCYAYCARHKHLNENRFLKVIDLPKGYTDLVLKEPRTLLAALNKKPASKNIIHLHDAEIINIKGNDYVLLQMEYIESQSLQKQLEQGQFGQQDAVRITQGILAGVAHLHSQRLVHRDLKPDNILVHDNIPKIADFGSIAYISDDLDFINASKHSDLYVPPEGWGSPKKYTFSSDLYQVALILYQLVNGPLPTDPKAYLTKTVLKGIKDRGKSYGGLDGLEKANAEKSSFAELTAKESLLEKMLTSRAYYSSAIRRIVQRAVRCDLRERYQTAQDFLSALANVSTPNWRMTENTYNAANWAGKDWRVASVKNKRGSGIIVEKAPLGSQAYRKCNVANALSEAFHFVTTEKN